MVGEKDENTRFTEINSIRLPGAHSMYGIYVRVQLPMSVLPQRIAGGRHSKRSADK